MLGFYFKMIGTVGWWGGGVKAAESSFEGCMKVKMFAVEIEWEGGITIEWWLL